MSIFFKTVDRVKRFLLYTAAMIVRTFTIVRPNRIFMWSYSFDKYACNPKAFTEYLLENHASEYEIYWAFLKSKVPSNIPSTIHIVHKYSLAYFRAMYTAKYIFNNKRNSRFDTMFNKKKSQKYIMMWHGSFALKKIEKDAEVQLGKHYVRRAVEDSKMCDLMLSNSKMYTNQIKSAFWYDGEILENCIPRNCVLYDETKKIAAYKEVRQSLGISQDCKIVLYAPTFRGGSNDLKYYRINWDKIIPEFEKMLGGNVKVLLRLHPNMSKIKDLSSITNYNNVYDVTLAPDITEFLLAADAMISDYTSAMFDFMTLGKPCFIYAIDINEYDRGFYVRIEDLPFPISTNEDELLISIKNFNQEKYKHETNSFIEDVWGLEEDGKACKRLYAWMKKQHF